MKNSTKYSKPISPNVQNDANKSAFGAIPSTISAPKKNAFDYITSFAETIGLVEASVVTGSNAAAVKNVETSAAVIQQGIGVGFEKEAKEAAEFFWQTVKAVWKRIPKEVKITLLFLAVLLTAALILFIPMAIHVTKWAIIQLANNPELLLI